MNANIRYNQAIKPISKGCVSKGCDGYTRIR